LLIKTHDALAMQDYVFHTDFRTLRALVLESRTATEADPDHLKYCTNCFDTVPPCMKCCVTCKHALVMTCKAGFQVRTLCEPKTQASWETATGMP
jgi:hypothetical protein